MKRTFIVIGIILTVAIFLWAQHTQPGAAGHAQFEVQSVFPREVSPGKYEQVHQEDLQSLATQGWELVGVTPYIYRNEEHGPAIPGPRPVVTQSYPAYFFKRVK